jgi:hypothetical protein
MTLCLALIPAGAAARSGKYVPLPAQKGRKTQIKMKFVDYTGGTNGQIIVDLKNTGQKAERFDPRGLYFVPNGNANSAPQRLGAAGPFQAREGNNWNQKTKLVLEPGATRRVRLQVFCIDSHRSSPGKSQGFSVARKRLPEKLQNEIQAGAHKILRQNKGHLDRSKGAIQSHIWKTRDRKWIKLEGERKNEKSSSGRRLRRSMQQRIQIQSVR